MRAQQEEYQMSEQQITEAILNRIQRLIDRGEEIQKSEAWQGYDDEATVFFDEDAFVGWRAQCMTFLEGFLGGNPYVSHTSLALADDSDEVKMITSTSRTLGILKALKEDVEAGYLTTLRELIHADMFGDFLEMAEYLLTDGFKDPAAVLVGGVLEEHLRQLSVKYGVDLNEPHGQPKKSDKMNADLVKKTAYTGLEQKQVTAWLDLRNKAAHGRYSEYRAEQVSLMLQGVRDFAIRHPA